MKNLATYIVALVLIHNNKKVSVECGPSRQSGWRLLSVLLAYMIASIFVFGAEVNLPDATDLESHGVTQQQLDGLDAIMLKAIKEGTIEGCSFLVAHRGEVVCRKAHGEFATDERVLLASVSKPLSASVIMALVDQGKLDLEDPV